MAYEGFPGEHNVDEEPSDPDYDYAAIYHEDSMGSPVTPWIGNLTGSVILGPGSGFVIALIPDPYGSPSVPPKPPVRDVPPRPKRWIRQLK